MISQKHLLDVCMNDCGSKTCRYLYNDDLDSSKWHCIKLKPIDKAKVDDEINSFLLDCKKRKINPKNLNRPLGDNCEGLLLLKNIKQGYDCES
jgi:hypothetical protein